MCRRGNANCELIDCLHPYLDIGEEHLQTDLRNILEHLEHDGAGLEVAPGAPVLQRGLLLEPPAY